MELKFRKYKEKQAFTDDRHGNIVQNGDISFVKDTKEVAIGKNEIFNFRPDKRTGGIVVVDKIYPRTTCVLPASYPKGYRIGYCPGQTVYIGFVGISNNVSANIGGCYYLNSEESRYYSTSEWFEGPFDFEFAEDGTVITVGTNYGGSFVTFSRFTEQDLHLSQNYEHTYSCKLNDTKGKYHRPIHFGMMIEKQDFPSGYFERELYNGIEGGGGEFFNMKISSL